MLLILGVMMVFSTLLVRSATYGNPLYPNYDIKTLIFFGVGFVVIIIMTLFDYRWLLKSWYVWYGLGRRAARACVQVCACAQRRAQLV